MKTDNQFKRSVRHWGKSTVVMLSTPNQNKIVNHLNLKHLNKQKPLTVTNNVTRLIFVANQPVKVTTSYLQTDKI